MIILLFGLMLLSHGVKSLNHAVVVPKQFRTGADETVVLNLYGYPAGTTVTAMLQALPALQGIIIQRNLQLNADAVRRPITLNMRVAENDIRPFQPDQKVRLTIAVIYAGGRKTIEIDVPVEKQSGYLFITTDRPVYKPGDFVGYKIFALNQAMRPDHSTLVTITIRTPDGIGVDRKQKILAKSDSFIEEDYEINSIPELGLWSIEANYTSNGYDTSTQTKFKVDYYELPTFQVKIELEKNYVLVGDPYINGTLRARYSYGKPVEGNCYIRALVKKTPNSDPKEFYKFPGSGFIVGRFEYGSRNFRIPVENLNHIHENTSTLERSKASIIIEASVNGRADGVFESAITPNLKVIKSPYVIDTSRTSPYYTPGLSYTLKFDVLNAIGKQPVSRMKVNVTVNGGDLRTFPTDEHGSLDLDLNLEARGNQRIDIVTNSSQLTPQQQGSTTITVIPYQSPSNSYLQIKSIRRFENNWQVKFSFNSRNIVDREIRYFIVARGGIVASGIKTFRQGMSETAETITITQEMVPSARLVAYYLVGSEFVANSLWFDVDNQCKTGLSLSVPEEVRPGENFNIDIEGPVNAKVSLLGVDRAAYFLYNGSRLTPKSMFDKMESYDQGCIRNGGRDASSVFQEAGLELITTTSARIAPPCGESTVSKRKKRNVVNIVNARSDITEEKCIEDGKRSAAVDEESCEARKLTVIRNAKNEDFYPGCADIFLEACTNETRRRYFMYVRGFGRSSGNAVDAKVSIAQLRKDFEENLVFDHIELSGEGRASYPALARDSITTFEIDAVSVKDVNDGFCVAQTANVRVFKDVFVQLYAPYSLKKMEQANLRLTVFNYGDKLKEVTIETKTEKDERLCTHFPSGEWNTLSTLKVGPNDANSTIFTVLPLIIPDDSKVSVWVKVTSSGHILDQVKKEILIEEYGELRDLTKSEPIDLKTRDSQEFNLAFNFNEDFVLGSRKCWIYAYVNFLGPSIEVDPLTKEPKNIEDIFRMPYGCGEQTMIISGPNVYTLMYLDASRKVNPGSAEYNAAVTKIKKGYVRELSHRSDRVQKRAFAVWSRYKPSTWLNAFVDKVFMKANLYADDLDIRPICNSLEWLLEQQQPDGHFTEQANPIHREMHGAVGGSQTLTAYVAISMLETQSRCSSLELNNNIQLSITRAITYLKNNKNNPPFLERPYAIALLSYALALEDPSSRDAVEIFDRLKRFKTEQGGTIHWKGRPNSGASNLHSFWYNVNRQAIDVEATAYALLAQVAMVKLQDSPSQSAIDRARKIVLWLIKQRNEGGAFMSTQDTVIGLQALAQYQIWTDSLDTGPKINDFTLSLIAPNTEWNQVGENNQRTLTDENEKFRTEIEVPHDVINHGSVDVTANGIGEGVVSYRCVYRSAVDRKPCHFNISHRVQIVDPEEDFQGEGPPPIRIKLTLTVSTNENVTTGMVIVEVGLMSGFVPNKQHLHRMSKKLAIDGVLDRYEVTNFKIILYLSEISMEPCSLQIEMKQTVFVQFPEPAKINVYEYLEPDAKCGFFYQLPGYSPQLRTTNCSNDQDSICRCAEGGCFTCRTRDQQMKYTRCTEEPNSCSICEDNNKCVDLSRKICERNRNYAYVVSVTKIDEPDDGAVFYTLSANILKVIRKGEHRTEEKAMIQFIVRKDCFQKCRDEKLENSKAARENPEKGRYFRPGIHLFITGPAPDKVVTKSGNEVHQYRLDENAFVERYLPKTKCNGKLAKKVRKCNRKKKKPASCGEAYLLDKMCQNYDNVEKQFKAWGCDNPSI